MRKILVTSGLPYANGSIHLGHMLEYLQTDIWVRFQKLIGNSCSYVCGDDAHGTPIMLSARQQQITPEELIATVQSEHEQDFAEFLIEFDSYYTTHSPENRELAEMFYQKLSANDDIVKRVITQAYDPEQKVFLPDRFIKGECPRCGAKDQYGDSCEVCGSTYSPTELKNPISAISGATPTQRDSEHYFFRLDRYQSMLKEWIHSGHVQPEIANKLDEWLKAGLQQWDISRDEPYFGFLIPGTKDKYFYVWLDAPMGYMAAFKKLCSKRSELSFSEYWENAEQTELIHFIGKDIVYFHALFWPAVLTSGGFRKPTKIFTHGFLTVNGQKMSKSRGTFIKARTYLQHLDPEYLRYYFAAKSTSRVDDIDLNLDDFMQRVNSDLVGKVVNIASRCAGFIRKKFANQLADAIDDTRLFEMFVAKKNQIAEFYEDREYNHAMREIMALADLANQYIDEKKPWVLAKDSKQAPAVHKICSLGINLFRVLLIYLQPVLPRMARASAEFLNENLPAWGDIDQPLLDHSINDFQPLLQRIEKPQIEAIIGS